MNCIFSMCGNIDISRGEWGNASKSSEKKFKPENCLMWEKYSLIGILINQLEKVLQRVNLTDFFRLKNFAKGAEVKKAFFMTDSRIFLKHNPF